MLPFGVALTVKLFTTPEPNALGKYRAKEVNVLSDGARRITPGENCIAARRLKDWPPLNVYILQSEHVRTKVIYYQKTQVDER